MLPFLKVTTNSEVSITEPPVVENNCDIPGAVQYSIRRFVRPQDWPDEEAAEIHYHYQAAAPEQNFLQLRFCIAGQMYCRQMGSAQCHQCKAQPSIHCADKVESIDALSFTFSSTLLAPFIKTKLTADTFGESLLGFRYTSSFTKKLSVCPRTRAVLEGLLNHSYTDTLENIYVNAQTQMLLLYSLNCLLGESELDVSDCKFLSNEADREKIAKAREILIQHIGEPITIKELSRKVAINECYLKKGFKEMFGTTIFDFYQSQRMEHARYLLYEKGLSVTDVSVLLGYSSISHFSTAFKKHTGIKPCELLR